MAAKLGFPGRAALIMAAAVRERFSSATVGAALAAVVFSSGFISYTHICALTLQEHGSWKTAHLQPVCIDGQIVIGSAYFMDGGTRWQKAAGLLLGVLPGIAESLVANWASGITHGHTDALWATVPAQAFACSALLFERWLQARRQGAARRKTAEGLLADALAEIEGLRESVEAASALADAALAAIPRRVPAAAGGRDPASPRLPAPVPWPPQVGPASPLPGPPPPARPPAAPLKSVPRAPAPAPRRERRAGEVPDSVMAALPQGEAALRALFDTTAANEVARKYQISRYWAKELRRQYRSPEEATRVA